MIDLRSYLGSRFIDGNFFAGVPMRIAWDMAPDKIAATVRATKASGRPLATQMLTSMRLGSALSMPTAMEANGIPRLTLRLLGAPPLVECLPYLPDRPPVYAASIEPDGPYGLTFVHGENAGAMLINAAFHDNVIDSAPIDQAIELIPPTRCDCSPSQWARSDGGPSSAAAMTLRKGLRTTIASLCVVVASTATSCASPDKQRFDYVRITVDGQETLGISKKDGAIRGVVVFFHGPDSNEFAMTADNLTK